MDDTTARVVRLLRDRETFVIAAHEGPDGDAVGSSLALGLLLEKLGKDVVVYNRDEIPYNFQFLPGGHLWTRSLEGRTTPDVTILLDCGEPGRIGPAFPSHGWGDEIVVIDHHKTFDPDFATLYFRDVDAAATGELIYEIATELGGLAPEVAENIYCCLMTDTGSFRYSNTSKRTFTIAGELVEAGVDPWRMTSHIYESQPRARLDLLGRVLDTLRLSDDGQLAFLRVERSMLEDTNATLDMIDGFINYARSVEGVEVATQLKEAGDSTWKVSFRSRGKVDVSSLARRFGGGGHHNAAGCTMQGAPQAIEQQLSEALTELLSR